MLDLYALNTGIITKIEATVALAAINGTKVAYGMIAEGVARPKCRFFVLGDAQDGTYGGALLSTVRYQFSVFADDLAVAGNLQKQLGLAFHNATVTLSSGTVVSARKVEGDRLLIEGQKPTSFVYHAVVVVEFRVLN